jgi:hypothetical protein
MEDSGMPEQPSIPILTGGCQCGNVRYALSAQPQGAHLCHCRMCQKAVGNVFAALAPVPLAALTWTKGEPAHFQSSSIAERGFCAHCGTPLYFRYLDQERICMTIGSLDQPNAVPPVIHYGIESRVSWLHLADQLPEAETEDEEDIRLAHMVNYQHGDQ